MDKKRVNTLKNEEKKVLHLLLKAISQYLTDLDERSDDQEEYLRMLDRFESENKDRFNKIY